MRTRDLRNTQEWGLDGTDSRARTLFYNADWRPTWHELYRHLERVLPKCASPCRRATTRVTLDDVQFQADIRWVWLGDRR